MTTTNNIVAKLAVAFVAVAMAFSLVAPAAQAQDVSSMSLEQLIALVNSLQTQLSGSATSSSTCSFTFTRSLGTGSTGADVMNLQKFLNSDPDLVVSLSGAGSPGMESSYYGPLTAAAVSKFQTKYSADILVPVGLSTPTGYFGPSSMAKANALCSTSTGGSTGGNTGGSTGALKGGAGNLDEAEFAGSLNNEEVGENQDDVEVVGWNIVPENSDIEIVAVDLDFDKAASSNSNFTKYASEVSIWLDGEEVARIDADEFTRSNNYRKSISLDRGAIIRDGDTGELVVAVSGISNIDSDDAGDTWHVGLRSLRYLDAQGAYITDNSTDNIGDSNDDTTLDTDERAFTFEDFSTASDMEFKVRSGDSSINNAQTIEVSSTTKKTNETILSFTVEVEGNSDMNIDELTVDATTTNALLNSVISTAYLYMDGDRVGSESITSTMATNAEIGFDNLDIDLDAGETYEFEVRVDFQKATGSFVTGTTIDADVSSGDVDDTAKWVIEDEQGDTVVAADRSGSASADAHTLVTAGVNITLGSTSAVEVVDANSTAANYGKFTMEVKVTAIGDTIYVKETAASSTSALTTYGLSYVFEDSSGNQVYTASSTSGSFSHKSGGTVDGSSIRVDEGSTVTFEFVGTYDPTSAGQLRARVVGIGFGTTSAGTGSSQTATPVNQYRSGNVFINN
ncbi:peptidoglycan-binding protein [Candidatus Nomurabacteria bacterium]|nr:peptidoglycan-binding protein [Candidatus Nomurabacteria bacterium]